MSARGEHDALEAPMPTRAAAGLDRGVRFTALALALGALLTFGWTVALRIGSPWPLEWMEGGILHHALRLAAFEPPYPAPSAEFVPYLYPPLGYLPAALSSLVFGGSLPAARASCLLGALVAMMGVGRLAVGLLRTADPASTDGARRLTGIVSASFFVLGFGYTGAFLDIVRIDAWFVALMVCGAERLAAGRERAGLWLLALSALAKQHGLLLFAAAAVGVLLRDGGRERRRALRLLAGPLLALVGASSVLGLSSGGWFLRYVYELPASHGLIPRLLLSFVFIDLLLLLPVLTTGAVVWLWSRRRTPSPAAFVLFAALLVSALGRAHAGGHDNVRMPALALLAAFGLAPLLGALLRTQTSARVRVFLLLALTLQWALLWQPPSAHAPTAASSAGFADLRGELERCARGGSAVALDHALLAGDPFVHTMALSDLRMGDAEELAAAGTRALVERLRGPEAPAAIAVGASFPELDAVLAAHYRPCARVAAPRMPTGYQPLPQVIHARTLPLDRSTAAPDVP